MKSSLETSLYDVDACTDIQMRCLCPRNETKSSVLQSIFFCQKTPVYTIVRDSSLVSFVVGRLFVMSLWLYVAIVRCFSSIAVENDVLLSTLYSNNCIVFS